MVDEAPVKRGRGRPKRTFIEGEPIPKRYQKPNEDRPLTTVEMVKIISDMTGYTLYESRFFYDAFCAVIHCELAYARQVILPSIGKLIPRIKTDVMGYDYLTKRVVPIPYSCYIRFKAADVLKTRIRDIPKRIAKERIAKGQALPPAKVDKKVTEEEQFI